MAKSIEINGIKFRAATIDWEDASAHTGVPVGLINENLGDQQSPHQMAKGWVAKVGKYLVIVHQQCDVNNKTGDLDCTIVPLRPKVEITYDK